MTRGSARRCEPTSWTPRLRSRCCWFEAWTVESSTHDHKAYYPGATELKIRLTGDLRSGALLGAQILGAWGAEVSKRLDIYATAMFQGMRVDQLSDLDLSYTLPVSSPWDPVQIAAQVWTLSAGRILQKSALRQ